MMVREVVALLEAGSEEFDKGNASAGLSILFEALPPTRPWAAAQEQRACVDDACSLADAATVGPLAYRLGRASP